MKKLSSFVALMLLSVVLYSLEAQAGCPLINAEGVVGVAFNPLAYTAATPGEEGYKVGPMEIAKPRIGAFYINLNDTDIDWTTMGIATAFNKRVELSFGYELVAIGGLPRNTHKENYGAKVALLAENAFGTSFVPAVSVGAIMKRTTFPTPVGVDDDGFDGYLVATKLITQLPIPVLLSAGVLSTKGHVNGIIGFDDQRKEVFFGNLDIFPTSCLVAGFEYKQGPEYGAYKDADYYNIHAGWFVDKNLTLIAAYANAGNRHSTRYNGLGGGPVISAQYSF